MIYHQSNLKHYFTCAKKMKLSMENRIPTNDAMREGLLFEGYVFNHFKDDNEKELIGRKKKETIDAIKAQAELVKPLFLEGESFVKLSHKTKDFALEGEADFIGTVNYYGEPTRCIADLKKTSDIEKIWNIKNRKHEYLQSVVYPYMWYKNTGEILPFVYIIVEDTYENPIITQRIVLVDEKDFQWFENLMDTVVEDIFLEPNTNACLTKFSRCEYLEFCEHGRKQIGYSKEIIFNLLED